MKLKKTETIVYKEIDEKLNDLEENLFKIGNNDLNILFEERRVQADTKELKFKKYKFNPRELDDDYSLNEGQFLKENDDNTSYNYQSKYKKKSAMKNREKFKKDNLNNENKLEQEAMV